MVESRERYSTGDPQLDRILGRIADRLDILEGLRPDLDAGLLSLDADKDISTVSDTTSYVDQDVRTTASPTFANLTISGDATIGDDLTVSSDLAVTQDLTVGDDLTVTGDAATGPLTVTGDTAVSGAMTVTGASELGDVTITGDAFFKILDENGTTVHQASMEMLMASDGEVQFI